MSNFCHQCGSSLESGDKFCRECGAESRDVVGAAAIESDQPEKKVDLAAEDGPEPEANQEASGPSIGDRSATIAGPSGGSKGLRLPPRKALLIALGSGLGVVAIAFAVLWTTGTLASPWDAEGAKRDRLETPFNDAMRQRADLLKLEARYVAALGTIQDRIARYEDAIDSVEAETEAIDQEYADDFDACFRYDIECPDPDYPDYPDPPRFGKELAQIRSLAGDLNQMEIELDLKTQIEPELRGFISSLVKSADALSEEANDNANLLNEAQEGDDEYRTVDTDMLDSLRTDTALPALVVLNTEALRAIALLDLDKDKFDVPGGQDRDKRDSSQAQQAR